MIYFSSACFREADSEVLGCEENLLSPLTTDMMEKIAMSPLIRDSIFNHSEEGLRWALGRSQAYDQRSWDSLGVGGPGLGDGLCERSSAPRGSAGPHGLPQPILMLDLSLTSPCQETQGTMCSFL